MWPMGYEATLQSQDGSLEIAVDDGSEPGVR